MSLKSAKFDDHWRHALARQYPVRLNELSFTSLRGLQDGSIVFANGITAIVGGNGVGKSTLAQATVDVLAGIEGVRGLRELSVRLRGELRVTVSGLAGPREVRVSVAADGTRTGPGAELEGDFVWLDPSNMAMLCQDQIVGDASFEDLLEASGPRAFDDEELALAAFLIGKTYSECAVWEIQDYGKFNVLPYFRVRCNDVTYGSEDMGRGELSLFILLWMLQRVPNNTVVVLEEPENHISARSQDALMNMIARACDRKGLWLVITTHSPVVVRRLPRESVRLLASTPAGSVIISNPRKYEIASILGGGVAYGNLLLTEDECGKAFALTLCELVDPDVRYQITAIATGGDSLIDSALRTLPRPERWSTRIVGVYDGDARTTPKPGLKWPHVFLPGHSAPEELLRDCLSSAGGSAQLAHMLSIEESRVVLAMDSAQGLDHHDWLERLAQFLGPDKLTVTRALVRAWTVANQDAANRFVADLRQAIG